MVPLILNLGSRWRRVVSVTPQPFNISGPEKKPLYPCIAGWLGLRVGLDVWKKIVFLCWESNHTYEDGIKTANT